MTKQLGVTFGDEVIAAGLGGKPFTWGDTDDSIHGRENLTAADNTTLDGVVAAHDPAKKHKNVLPTLSSSRAGPTPNISVLKRSAWPISPPARSAMRRALGRLVVRGSHQR